MSQRLQPLIQVVASFPAPMLFPLVRPAGRLHVPFTAGCVALMLLERVYILFNVIAGASAIPAIEGSVGRLPHGRWERWTRRTCRAYSRTWSPA